MLKGFGAVPAMHQDALMILALAQLFPQPQDLLMANNWRHGGDLLENGMLVREVIDIPLELLIGVLRPHNDNCVIILTFL